MRALGLALILLSAPVLAGCLGDDSPLNPANLADRAGGVLSGDIVRFNAHGDVLPLPGSLGDVEYLLTGHEGAEPNMGITQSGAIFVTAADQVLRSTDGGSSWEVVYHFAPQDDGLPTLPRGAVRSFDPMLWVDPVTDIVYADPMFPPLACSHLAWSTDDGESWFERPAVCHPPPMDHQKFATGVPGPDAPPVAGMAHETVLYQCYNMLVSTNCGVSYDGGLDWVVHTVASDVVREDCGGINGHPATSADGVVAVPMTTGCDAPAVAISTDSGLTWTVHKVPGASNPQSLDAEVSFDPDGNLFYNFRGNDHKTYLARSADHGATWDGPWVATPPGVESTVFHAMAAGADGRVALAFLGTRDTDSGPDEAEDDARWYLWIVTTADGLTADPTFTGYRVTPEADPVQVGRICMGGVGCNDGSRNLLDFIDGAVSPDGTFHVTYTEGCIDACDETSDPEDSRDRIIAVGKLENWSLW